MPDQIQNTNEEKEIMKMNKIEVLGLESIRITGWREESASKLQMGENTLGIYETPVI